MKEKSNLSLAFFFLFLKKLSFIPIFWAPLFAIAESVSVKFVAIGFSDTISNLAFHNGDDWVPIEIPEATRSREYEYSGSPAIRFAELPVPEEGEPRIVAEAKIAETLVRPLLIFVKSNEDDDAEYRVISLEDSREDFEQGSYRIINLAQRELWVVMGDQKIQMDANAIKTIAPEQPSRTYFAFQVYAFDGREDRRRLFSSRWFYEADSRMLVFVLNNPDNGLVVLKSVYDKVLPEP